MITATTTHHFFTLITIMLTSTISSQTPSPSSPCADSVISFSPCLPYISAPPNNLSNEPSSQCCDIFNGAFDSEDADCRCYLVRQNSLLGFQLNVTKLMWLSDLCSVKNGVQANDTVNSLDSICLGIISLLWCCFCYRILFMLLNFFSLFLFFVGVLLCRSYYCFRFI